MLSRDFDPYDLRMRLPVAVAQLHNAIEAHKGKTAYVHCTAGLGRAPGVAVRGSFPCSGLCQVLMFLYVSFVAVHSLQYSEVCQLDMQLAYMYWLRGLSLKEANDRLQVIFFFFVMFEAVR